MLHGAKPIATCDAMEFLAMYEPLQGDAKSSTHTVVIGIFDFFDPPCTKAECIYHDKIDDQMPR